MHIEFASNERPTIGIELELSIIDREHLGLVSAASDLLTDLARARGGEHPKAKHELFECTVEIITDVCDTVGAARADLETTLGELRAVAGPRNLVPVSVGTHPFSRWREQQVSPSERYAELLEEMQWTARRLLIFGVHYHVAVRSPEKSIAIATQLQHHLPLFLLLSASSPYWEAHDTGMASSRIKVFESLPTAGLPPRLGNWREFEEFMATLIEAGCIKSIREVWWDIRPHPNFGTVELRMCDAPPTLKEAAAIGALAQSLVHHLDRLHDQGRFPPPPREWTVRENKWLAARYGIESRLIVDESGRRRPATELIRELVAELLPAAEELGCADELRDVLAITAHGPSYVRQRHILERGGTPRDIVAALVQELETDTPVCP